MGTTVKRLAIVIAAAATVACAEDTFSLDIRVPSGFQVTKLELQVMQPPGGDAFDCDDLAFGFVADSVIDASTTRAVEIGRFDEAPLGSLERRRRHLFHVRGHVEDELGVLEGCVDVESLDTSEPLVLAMEPIVDVAGDGTPIDTSIDGPIRAVELRLTDMFERPVAGVPVRWVARVQNREVGRGEVVSERDGFATVQVPPATIAGPLSLDFAIRWGVQRTFRVPGFVRPPPIAVTIDRLVVGDVVAGSVGPGGAAGVALSEVEIDLPNVASVRFCGVENGTFNCDTSVPHPLNEFGALLPEPEGVLSVSESGMWRVTPDGTFAETMRLDPTKSIAGIFATGPCPATTGVLISYDDGDHEHYDVDGRRVVFPELEDFDGSFARSGCVAGEDELYRTFFFEGEFGSVQMLTQDESGFGFGEWNADTFGLGLGPFAGGTRYEMLGAVVQLNEIIIAQARLLRFDEEVVGAEVSSIDFVPAFPISIAAGHIDDDDSLDVAAVLGDFISETRVDYSLWIATDDGANGRNAGTIELSPLLACGDNRSFPVVFMQDLRGDGRDDVVVVERNASSESLCTEMRVFVFEF